MQDTFPKPVAGAELRATRLQVGIGVKALAEAIGIKRNALYRWEHAESLDAVRAARYARALRTLTEKEMGL